MSGSKSTAWVHREDSSAADGVYRAEDLSRKVESEVTVVEKAETSHAKLTKRRQSPTCDTECFTVCLSVLRECRRSNTVFLSVLR